jgi:hypothetical protein
MPPARDAVTSPLLVGNRDNLDETGYGNFSSQSTAGISMQSPLSDDSFDQGDINPALLPRKNSLERRLAYYRALTKGADGRTDTDSARGVRFFFEPPPHVIDRMIW